MFVESVSDLSRRYCAHKGEQGRGKEEGKRTNSGRRFYASKPLFDSYALLLYTNIYNYEYRATAATTNATGNGSR